MLSTATDADGDTATLGFGWRVTLAVSSYLLVSSSATNATGTYTVSWGFSGGATSYELQEQADACAWSTAHSGAGRSVTFTDRPNVSLPK